VANGRGTTRRLVGERVQKGGQGGRKEGHAGHLRTAKRRYLPEPPYLVQENKKKEETKRRHAIQGGGEEKSGHLRITG